jgi:hypothetical protein
MAALHALNHVHDVGASEPERKGILECRSGHREPIQVREGRFELMQVEGRPALLGNAPRTP